MRYVRALLLWLVDLAVVAAAIACIMHVSRRYTISCGWHGVRASCRLEAEDSLGRVEHREIDGIRGVAYRRGTIVGLVTDARNKDTTALFGTSEIDAPTAADAETLRAFADDRVPDHVGILSGVAHPRWVTGLLLAAILVYGFLSGRARRAVARREANV